MYKKYIKRILDIICALLALTVFFSLYIVVAILVKVKLGSPIIFKQKRPGKNEKIFTLYKFRTMTDACDINGKLLPDSERLTRFGKFLRKTSLDELPEAFNILKGDMSVVGPRPLLVRDMVFFNEEQMKRQSVLPGLTGLAQISGRNAICWEDKLQYDLVYIQNIKFLNDCRIIFSTVFKAFIRCVDITAEGMDTAEDFGDYLLRENKVDKEYYKDRIETSKDMLGV